MLAVANFPYHFVIGSSPEMKIIFLRGETALARTNRRYLLKYYGIYFLPEFVRFPAANFSKLSPHQKPPSLSHPRMCYNNLKYLHAESEHEVDTFYKINIFKYYYYSFYIYYSGVFILYYSSKEINKVFIDPQPKMN